MQNLFYQIIIYTHEIIVKYFFDGSVVWMISWVVHFYLFSVLVRLVGIGRQFRFVKLVPSPNEVTNLNCFRAEAFACQWFG